MLNSALTHLANVDVGSLEASDSVEEAFGDVSQLVVWDQTGAGNQGTARDERN